MAMRSVRLAEPVLIWPALVATAMSAMVVSSVSPLRWLMIGGEAVALGQFDGVERFGQGADLVDLDEDAVAGFLVDALLQAFGVGDEQIVADELDLAAQLAWSVSASRPSRPRPGRLRASGSAISRTAPSTDRSSHRCWRSLSGLLLKNSSRSSLVLGFLEQLGGGRVEGEGDLVAELVAGLFDRPWR